MKRLFIIIASLHMSLISVSAEQVKEIWGPAVKTINVSTLASQELKKNRVYKVSGKPEQGFYWSYFFAVPDSFKPDQPILVLPNNDGRAGVSTAQGEYFASAFAEEGLYAMARKLGVAVLVPSFP
ncbi:MAG: hypothetical protein V2I33_01070 [Kangiellaceae bacterium]|nr:hypothetical protein [Kangiellaceae bacterium]